MRSAPLRVVVGLLAWGIQFGAAARDDIALAAAQADLPAKVSSPGPAPSGSRLVGASAPGHLWVVSEVEEVGFALLHHSPLMGEMMGAVAATLDEWPSAAAASGESVWVVFPSQQGKRRVVSLRAEFHPALGQFSYLPSSSLQVEPSLPGDGELLDFSADQLGPVALMDGPTRALRLQRGEWVHLDALATGVERDGPHLGADSRPVRGGASAAILRMADGFVEVRWDMPPASPLLERFKIPASPWTVLGMDGKILLLRAESVCEAHGVDTGQPFDFGVIVTELGPRDGSKGVRVIRRLGIDTLWQVIAPLSLIASMLIMVALSIRRRLPTEFRLGQGATAIGGSLRALAFAIDLLPAAAIVSIWQGVSLFDALRPPLLSPDWDSARPATMALLLAIAVASTTECLLQASLGKQLLGLKVAGQAGMVPHWVNLLLRSWARLLLLAMPPLIIFTLLNRLGRGIPESLTDTAVVKQVRSPAHANRPGAESNPP